MQIPRKQIESALKKKGFTEEETHHRYFYHEVNGQRTGAYTFTSRGSSYKDYQDNLLGSMRRTLKLDTKKQLGKLIDCSMSGRQYNEYLEEKGIIPKNG